MASLVSKKSAFAADVVDLSARILRVCRDADELNSAYFANLFNSGAANALTDADFDQSANPHLTAAIVASFITTIQALSSAMTSASRDNLRKAVADPLP